MSSVAQRVRAEARMYEVIPEPDDVCVCGHRGDAHVFSCAEDEPIYCSCFGVPVHPEPKRGWCDEDGLPRSATCSCWSFQALQDTRC